MSTETLVLAVVASTALLAWGAVQVARIVFVKTAPPGMALVVTPKSGETRVSFSSALVLPGFHQATLVDITVKLIKVLREKSNPLLSRDDQRFRAVFTFYVRISRSEDGVLNATQTLGENPMEPVRLRERLLPSSTRRSTAWPPR